jgi:hypothetical protein
MKQNIFPFHQCSKVAILIVCLILFVGTTHSVFAQKAYKYTSEQYKRQGTRGLVVGGILIVGGTIGAIAHNATQSKDNSSTPFAIEIVDASKIVWPAAIAGGTIASIIGLDHLIKSKKIGPVVGIQKIPGLEHMGIKYPKLPTIGIKYSF